jgi:hypothetical protein
MVDRGVAYCTSGLLCSCMEVLLGCFRRRRCTSVGSLCAYLMVHLLLPPNERGKEGSTWSNIEVPVDQGRKEKEAHQPLESSGSYDCGIRSLFWKHESRSHCFNFCLGPT